MRRRAGREEGRQCSREKGWQSVVLLICTVKGEGLTETQGKGCQRRSKGAALAGALKI